MQFQVVSKSNDYGWKDATNKLVMHVPYGEYSLEML